MKKYTYLCLFLIVTTVLTGCQFLNDKDPEKAKEIEYTQLRSTFFPMDTILDIVVQTKDENKASKAMEEAKKEMDRLEQILSSTIESSEVSLINRSAGIAPVKVSSNTFEIIEMSLHYAEITRGKFDITIAPLLKLYDWRLGKETGLKPEQEKIDVAKELIDYKDVIIDKENSTVYLKRENMEIDLGGIAKGYIIDRAIEVLESFDVEYGYVNGGGDIRFIGSKSDGSPWRTGVNNPRGEGNIAIISSEGKAILSSGDYERFFITSEGERIHHIIDPHTGASADFAQSVTILADNATIADILSTSLFMFPVEEGINLAKSLGVEVLVVTIDGEIVMTEGMENIATLTQ